MVDEKLSAPLDDFKEREIEILELMADGASNQEIADQLFITKGTVRWYNKHIYSKLGTSRRTEAIALARDMGLLGEVASTDEQVTRHRLPTTTGPFIGRDAELEDLSALLQQADIRLLSLVATGGMGKSRLSLELGHLIKNTYAHGAVFIDLAPVRNPDDIASFALTSLNLSISDKKSPKEILFNYCREKELLLIFDNFEHVLTGSSLLSELLEVAPKITLIVTTRERLNLRTETVFYLQPISNHADALFLEVASMIRPNIEIKDEEHKAIHRVVELVGGLPLGLVLAATWIDTLSVAEIADEIDASLDFLNAEMGDMPERQRSIHAVIDPTWKRLSKDEQNAFMQASVFRGGFTRKLFQQVTGASVRAIQTLLNRSLISHGYERRYIIHPLLRQYAREKLAAHQLVNDAKMAHLATMTTYAQTHADRMYRGYYLEALDALEHEADNIRAALDWSLQGHEIEQGVLLVLANCEFWQTRSKILEALAYVEKALSLTEHPKLLYWQSVYLDRLGEIDRSMKVANQVIAYGEAHHNPEILAYGQSQLAMMQSKTEAKLLLEKALVNAQEVDNPHLIANCNNYLSLIEDDSGNHREQALEIFEALGDLHGISRVTNNLAIKYYDVGRIQEAKDLMDYSLQLKRQIGDRAGEARRLTTLSIWAITEEAFEQAQDWLAESRVICEALGELQRLSYVLTTEGLLYIYMRDFKQAQITLEHELHIAFTIKDYRSVVDNYGLRCQLYLLQNNEEEACDCLQKGIDNLQHNQEQPATLLLAYANYLWYMDERDQCMTIAAALSQRKFSSYLGNTAMIRDILLQPLVYRIRQRIGDAGWQQLVAENADVTLPQLVQHITQTELP